MNREQRELLKKSGYQSTRNNNFSATVWYAVKIVALIIEICVLLVTMFANEPNWYTFLYVTLANLMFLGLGLALSEHFAYQEALVSLNEIQAVTAIQALQQQQKGEVEEDN